MEENSRVLMVSHRLPVTAVFDESSKIWKWSYHSGTHSSMGSGLKSLKGSHLWIGWLGEKIASEKGKEIENELLNKNCVAVYLDRNKASGHYDVYCKTILWPLFHYVMTEKVTDGRKESDAWRHYVSANQSFADKVVQVYRPGDLIWVHDYHLMLVPMLIRRKIPNASIGFFLHTPFPSSELFRCLPNRKEILQGMLEANLIGFQTYSYSRHFASTCTRLLGLESNPKGIHYGMSFVSVGIFPIGIDIEKVNKERIEKCVTEKIDSLQKHFKGKKIIISRDKLDYIKGVKQKIISFESFLDMYPEWRGKVVLIQVTSPRQNVSKESNNFALESQVSELVNRVNGKYGSLEFSPIHYINQKIERSQYYALLSIADACLITSLRDGMNLTSHEYVVCQQDNYGPLILSEFTGSAGSLGSAFLINPWDYRGVAEALNEALSIDSDLKKARHTTLLNFIEKHTVQFWCQSFVSELKKIIDGNMIEIPDLDSLLVSQSFKNSNQRLILLDYDGTLTPIVKTPPMAKPTEGLLQVLREISSIPNTFVFVISGRDQATLDEWISSSCPNVGLSAEHGSFIKYPKASKWIDLTAGIDFSWKSDILPILEFYTERTPGSFIEHKKCSLAWHYRLADPEFGSWQAKECHTHLENGVANKLPVEILIGKKNLEVRSDSISKGEVVRRILNIYPNSDFVLCMGDDRTDEDMFNCLLKSNIDKSKVFNCIVGAKKSTAAWKVDSPVEVVSLLKLLAST